MERMDSRSSKEVVGGECCMDLKVVIVDRTCVLSVVGFIDVLVSDSWNLGEEGFSQALRDPRGDAFLR